MSQNMQLTSWFWHVNGLGIARTMTALHSAKHRPNCIMGAKKLTWYSESSALINDWKCSWCRGAFLSFPVFTSQSPPPPTNSKMCLPHFLHSQNTETHLTASILKKRSKTHKRLEERFLIRWHRTKRAKCSVSPLFQATYNKTTENS